MTRLGLAVGLESLVLEVPVCGQWNVTGALCTLHQLTGLVTQCLAMYPLLGIPPPQGQLLDLILAIYKLEVGGEETSGL